MGTATFTVSLTSMNQTLHYKDASWDGTIVRNTPSSWNQSKITITSATVNMAGSTFSEAQSKNAYIRFGKYGCAKVYSGMGSAAKKKISLTAIEESTFTNLAKVTTSSTSINVSAKTDTSGTSVLVATYPNAYPTFTITATYEEDTGYKASTGSISPVSVGIGGTVTLTITNDNLADLHHTAKLQITNNPTSYYISNSVAKGSDSTSFTIPSSWADAFGSSNSVGFSVILTTLNDNGETVGDPATIVGTLSKSSGTSPTLSLSYEPDSWYSGNCLQGISGIDIIATAAGQNGATIAGYTLSGGASATVSTSQSPYTFNIRNIPYSGNVTYKVTVTDSLGQSTSKYITISVTTYTAPTITVAECYRADSSGEQTTDGTYIYAKINGTIYYGTKACSYQYKQSSSGTYGTKTSLTANTLTRIASGIDVNSSYDVKLILGDGITETEFIKHINTKTYTMHFKNTGVNIAFGKYCENGDGSPGIEIPSNWNIYRGTTTPIWGSGGTLGIASGGTGATTASGARSNIGAAASDHTHSGYASSSHTHSISEVGFTTASRTNASQISVSGGSTVTQSFDLSNGNKVLVGFWGKCTATTVSYFSFSMARDDAFSDTIKVKITNTASGTKTIGAEKITIYGLYIDA